MIQHIALRFLTPIGTAKTTGATILTVLTARTPFISMEMSFIPVTKDFIMTKKQFLVATRHVQTTMMMIIMTMILMMIGGGSIDDFENDPRVPF